jgi:phage terminase large subunit-like protein
MWRLVEHGRAGADPAYYFAEFAAPAGCEVDDPDAWTTANPALDDFLHRDALAATLRTTRETVFRRYRLGQWVDSVPEPWLPPGTWDECAVEHGIDDGADVVIGFDGSFNGDATAIVAAAVDECPHLDVVRLWERPHGAPEGWQVPILDVEDALRQACRRWHVRELVADPYRWARTMQLLDAEGLPVVDYPQTPARMTPATTTFYEAVVNRALTHSGDADLARHIANCTVRTDSRGTRLAKEHKHSTRRIDLAVAAVMAHARAVAAASMKVLQVY